MKHDDECGSDDPSSEYLSISKMASLHDISRQALIHYDHIGLFKPIDTSGCGYRHYSPQQIPFLREICLMRNLGFSLEEIKEHLETISTSSACSIMSHKLTELDQTLQDMAKRRKYLAQRLEMYEKISAKIKNIDRPYIEWLPERSYIFAPYPSETMEKGQLHLTLMKAWNESLKYDIVPASGFGSLIRYSSMKSGTPLKRAGSILNLPAGEKPPEGLESGYTAVEGEYVVMYKYGMPYDTTALTRLLAWMSEHKFSIAGDDIIDQCLLDATHYNNEHNVDFCMLQVRIS